MTDWIFFGPARLVALWPYAGFAIGAILIAVQAALTLRAARGFGQRFFREAAVFAGLLWWIFNAFEWQMNAIAGANGGGLRLDLIVLVPILYVLTVAAVLSIRRQWRDGRGGTEGQTPPSA